MRPQAKEMLSSVLKNSKLSKDQVVFRSSKKIPDFGKCMTNTEH